MKICILTDELTRITKTVMRDVMRLLGDTHIFLPFIVPVLPGANLSSSAMSVPEADLYLLKAHVPRVLEVGKQLEELGFPVINNWASTQICQDRVALFERLQTAQIPIPRTWRLDRFADDLTDDLLASLLLPVIVKTRYAYESMSVDKADTVEQLKRLAFYWGFEPVVIQQCVLGDGWDIKVWVIGDQLFAAKRRSPLDSRPKDQFQISLSELGEKMSMITLSIGRLFGLEIYGVDFLMTAQGPMVIDVNSFPGYTGLVGADKVMAAYLDRACHERVGSQVHCPPN